MANAPIHSVDEVLDGLPANMPVLIAGPTASGKSALALEAAARCGGIIVNADASQVYDCWRVLTARPSEEEEASAPHALYGHISATETYSAGHWLREVRNLLAQDQRLIIVGGTGLYFSALTRGLADIPATPPEIRTRADGMSADDLLKDIDVQTRHRLDTANRMRVQRAWEVQTATGRGLAAWQDDTGPALIPEDTARCIVFDAPKDWLTPRIAQRFDMMLDAGALEEARTVLPHFDPSLPAHRAIGAPELIAHLRGEKTLDEARGAAVVATRQFAKRQRTWFRSKMKTWWQFRPAENR
ncbi:tRNA (adenosine(37)-N6)-dimethylallyltransferase MiaA [uncultured Roseobacter sp.]|uniref:tRNA (adenosine(37)-N6)-dimethylallyltransferase MiaA n=1 Tax=uncultured Roseobacter sp. TaxID=114847 RepID=UPI00262E5E9B|nr:tRNA (adenosine(37)-N6)-dimethylallyltransferase MiaA [uncultured Roseobacter sp.]